MTTLFIGIFTGGKIISKDNLFDLKDVPYLEYISRKELHHELKTPNDYICEYPKFTAINLDGTKRILKAGNFEIIDIGHDEGKRNFEGRNITISESNGQQIHTYRSLIPSFRPAGVSLLATCSSGPRHSTQSLPRFTQGLMQTHKSYVMKTPLRRNFIYQFALVAGWTEFFYLFLSNVSQ